MPAFLPGTVIMIATATGQCCCEIQCTCQYVLCVFLCLSDGGRTTLKFRGVTSLLSETVTRDKSWIFVAF